MDHYNEVNAEDVKGCMIVVIGGSDTWIYSMAGTEVKQLDKFSILREKSHRKGGQSSARFQANRECQMRDYGNLIRDRVTAVRQTIDAVALFVVSNSGLGQQMIPSGHFNDMVTKYIDMDLSNWTISRVTAVVRPLLDDIVNDETNGQIQMILSAFSVNPENWIIGKQELLEYINGHLWAIKKIYIHTAIYPSLEDELRGLDDRVYIIDGNNHHAEIFLKSYSGIIAEVSRVNFEE